MMRPLDEWVLTALRTRGWLPSEGGSVQSILESYQRFHGLDVTAELDRDTQLHLIQPRFCALPDRLSLTMEQTTRKDTALWSWRGPTLRTVSDAEVRRTIQQAFDAWTAVARCSAREAVPNETPDCVITSARIDGPSGVLAQMTLPGPRTQQGQVDNGEAWIIQLGRLTSSAIDLFRVLTHELGHFWGIGHIDAGNLMATMYSPSIWLPQAGDTKEMRARYGAPKSTPPAGDGPTADKVLRTLLIYQSGRVDVDGKQVA